MPGLMPGIHVLFQPKTWMADSQGMTKQTVPLSLSSRILPMPASQHQSPKTDIEISQAAKKRPIINVARERLGLTPENLEPYGHYKAKVSMDFIKSLQNKPNGKLILVSAINPTPAG